MSEHDDEMMVSGEFDDGQALNTGATEAIIAKRLTVKGTITNIFSRPDPKNHIKNNWKLMLGSTAVGTGLAYVGALSQIFSDTVDPLMIAASAALSYPTYKILGSIGATVAFAIGHQSNMVNTDRFKEVKYEPFGRGLGYALASALMFAGNTYADTYLNAIGNLTYRLPATITAGVPSFLVDTFTNLENTGLDAVWERDDQLSCLGIEARNPEHICKSGPASEFIETTVDEDNVSFTITDVDAYSDSPESWDYWDASFDNLKTFLGMGGPN